jgi:hypothetical protein
MAKRYEAAPTMSDPGLLCWYVRENTASGATGWIKCFCYSETAATEIAAALNAAHSAATNTVGAT